MNDDLRRTRENTDLLMNVVLVVLIALGAAAGWMVGSGAW